MQDNIRFVKYMSVYRSMVTKTFSRLNPTNYIKTVRNHRKRTIQSFPGTQETQGDGRGRSTSQRPTEFQDNPLLGPVV